MTLSRSSRRAKPRWLVLLIALAALLLVLAASALAVHDNTALELDGNTVNDGAAGDDWDNLDDGLGDPGNDDGALISGFQHDEAQPDVSHHEPSNKDDQGVEDWGCVRKMNVSDKDDLRHAYAAAYDIGGDLHLFFGADRDTNNGSANIAAWFFQTPVSCVVGPGPQFADGAFAGHKTDGDLFIVSEFTNGGRVSGVNIYIWTDPTPLAPESGDECLGDGVDCSTAHSGQDHPAFTGIDCQVTNPHANPGSPNVCATVNGDGDGKHEPTDAIDVPWETTEDPESAEFFEGGLNLDALFPTGLDCFSQVMIETRSSFEFNANLFDISFLDFDTCGDITAHKYLDVNGNGQDDGEPALEGWTINLYASDGTTLLDSGTTDSDGDVLFADLTAGTYVVCEELISDTPPWINTDPAGVTLCETVVLGALGNEVADFGNGQPDIEVTKAADITQVCAGANTLVTYTYHVINAGTVELTGVTVSDDTIAGAQAAFELANGASDTLAVGADVTFTLTATINATTTNIVTAAGNYGPATPADSDTDTALVTAFDCDIEVTKAADITEVCIGADTLVTYTVTVSNAGNVELTNVDVVDDNGTPLNTADDVAVFTDQTLAPAGETGDELSTTFSRTINATTTNTVTATGDALGNSPADSDTDTATVTAFDCDIEVTKAADITQVCAGANTLVTYTYHVINAGTVELTGVTVSDDTIAGAQAAFELANGASDTLAVGADVTFTLTATINATTTNIVTAAGNALGQSPADSDTDTATVTAEDCGGNLFHTGTTCQQFLGIDPPSGLAGEEITEILYGVKQNKINNTAPGVFFYYTLIEAPNTAPAAFTVDIVQTETHATFSTLFGVQQQNQIRLFDGDCSTPEVQFSISNGGGQAHVTITGASPGQTFVISVKYDTSTVKGQNVPNPTTVHYDFRTEIGGVIVDEDEDGLSLAKKT